MAGHIIAVLGGKGGVGKSQFATNLAFSYAVETKGKGVLLLDFDQRASGDLNFLTGIKAPKTLKELSEFGGAIDQRSLIPFLGRHKTGVQYIGMPNDPDKAGLVQADGLGKFLKAAPNFYPVTVVDCGHELNALSEKVLEYATMIAIVITPDLLVLNQTRKLISELESALYPKDMITIFLNQHQKGHPVTPDVVKKTLGKPVFSMIPRDDNSCLASLQKKQPVMEVAKTGPFAKGITETVRKIIQTSILKKQSALKKSPKPASTGSSEGPTDGSSRKLRNEVKQRIHNALRDNLDKKDNLDTKDPKELEILKMKVSKLVAELINKEDTKGIANTQDEKKLLQKEILDEALGLGPLEDLLSDKTVSEVMVCGPERIYFEQGGKIQKSKIEFTSDQQVRGVIERIVAPIGRRIDEKTPYVDARLADGSRVHAIIPPCALDGCTITIRKFPENRLGYKDLVNFGSMTKNMADFLRIAVEGHRNIVVSGGTGSGKTTLINVLGGFIQSNERIITCEDSAELDFPQDHVVRLETRPPSLEGDGAIDIRCLVKQTLRMRPDRIVVGECRGGETLDMLQAMGTGHDGSMTTVHSNNPRECIGRIETLVQYAGAGLSAKAIREMISSAVHLIIQQSRLDDGSRKVTHVTEVQGMQGDVVTLQDIFLFMQRDIDKNGKIIGEFQATGFIPKFIETLERKGVNIPRTLFQNNSRGAGGPAKAAPTAKAPPAGAKKPLPPGKKPPLKKRPPGSPPPKKKP